MAVSGIWCSITCKLTLDPVGAHEDARFQTLVLLDDFSASGTSYIRRDGGSFDGKIASFCRDAGGEGTPTSMLFHRGHVELIVLLYMATDEAIKHIKELCSEAWRTLGDDLRVDVVHRLPPGCRIARNGKSGVHRLIDEYYDDTIHDVHMRKGGTPDAKYGYADGGLPVVLHHNTPNNSVSILWSYEGKNFQGLFPRVRRHKEAH